MSDRVCLENIAIVLNQPRFSENIGAAARAMRNMGIRRLIVVDPYRYDPKRVEIMATQAAADVVAEIAFYDTLAEALGPFSYVVGTTARLGGQRQVINDPAVMAQRLLPISQENQVVV